MPHNGLRAVDAFSEACRSGPSLARRVRSRKGVGLYGWNTGPVQEVHLPETEELVLSLHLGGSRRVRVFTSEGLSRSVSRPGDVTLMPQGRPVSFRTDGAVDFATVHFPSSSGERGDHGDLARLLRLSNCLFAFRDDYVCASVKTLMQAARSPSQDDGRYVGKLADALIARLARLVEESDAERVELGSPSEPPQRQANLDAVLALIEKRLADKLSLDDLAESAGMSRAWFARAFNQRYGCPPHRYIVQRRIERAKELLRNQRMSFTDIAYEVGFSGQSHFSAAFKAIEGCTPNHYTRAALESSAPA